MNEYVLSSGHDPLRIYVIETFAHVFFWLPHIIKSLMIYESALVVVAWSHEPFITVTTFIGAHRTTWFSPNMLPNMTLNHLDVYDNIFFWLQIWRHTNALLMFVKVPFAVG